MAASRGVAVLHMFLDSRSLIEDERKDLVQRAHNRWNSKKHIPLVSLLFWCKMVAVHCFVWPLVLRPWSVSQAKIQVLAIFKNSISGHRKCFVVFNAVLCIILTSTIL